MHLKRKAQIAAQLYEIHEFTNFKLFTLDIRIIYYTGIYQAWLSLRQFHTFIEFNGH